MKKKIFNLIFTLFCCTSYSLAQEGTVFSLYFYTPEKYYNFEIYKYQSDDPKFLLLKINQPIRDPYKLVLVTDSLFDVWMKVRHRIIPFCSSWIHLSANFEPQKKLFIYFDGTRKRKYRYQVRWLDADFEKQKSR